MDLSKLITNLEAITEQLKILNGKVEKRQQTIEEIKEEYPIPDGFTVDEYWKVYKKECGYSLMTKRCQKNIYRDFIRKYRPEKYQEILARDRNRSKNK